MAETIYIRAQAGPKRGFAHLRRCMILATAIKDHGAKPILIQSEDETVAIEFIRRERFEIAPIPKTIPLGEEAAFYPAGMKNILLDLVHADTLKDPLSLTNLMHDLIDKNIRIAFIDGMFDEAFKPPSMPHIECVIQPYVGAETDIPPKCNSWLAGGQYAILGPQFKSLPQRQLAPKVNNILITFGGADPQGLSAKVLEAMPRDINIRAVVGPYFSDEHRAQIKKIKAPNVTLVENEMDLLPHYLWADICITGSGISRYECAATGLPVIFAGLYDYHERVSRLYAHKGLGFYIGNHEKLTAADWQMALNSLIQSYDLRASLSAQSHKNIDSEGTGRIVSHLIQTVFSSGA